MVLVGAPRGMASVEREIRLPVEIAVSRCRSQHQTSSQSNPPSSLPIGATVMISFAGWVLPEPQPPATVSSCGAQCATTAARSLSKGIHVITAAPLAMEQLTHVPTCNVPLF